MSLWGLIADRNRTTTTTAERGPYSCQSSSDCVSWQRMSDWQLNEHGIQLAVNGRIQQLLPRATTRRVRSLTLTHARRLLHANEPPDLVFAERADEDALIFMRANHRSYVVESSGEAYVAPYSSQLHFDTRFAAPSAAGVRNPFAPRASRVARRLLLDPSESFSVQQLSELTEVDNGHVSRTVATLADRGFVEVTRPQRDERLRLIHLVSPLGLLEDWLQYWRRTQPIAYQLDIGTRSFEETVRAIADAAEPSTPYAISGLAGASFVRRVVEPTNVLLLTVKTGLERWSELLLARRERQGQGLVRVAAVQDDFIFKLVHLERRVQVADPVQLWLDTATSGERASVASDAIADLMSWRR